jgi:hypothetical protein
LCGLPLLYRDSGCLPEYCTGFGLPFSGPEDLPTALQRLIGNYAGLAGRMPSYPHTAERMIRQWMALFESLIAEREALVGAPRLWRDPLMMLANQIAL